MQGWYYNVRSIKIVIKSQRRTTSADMAMDELGGETSLL